MTAAAVLLFLLAIGLGALAWPPEHPQESVSPRRGAR